MTQKQSHTATPWEVDARAVFRVFKSGEHNRGICSTGGYQSNQEDTTDENAANAAFIVRAANAHQSLVSACIAAERFVTTYGGPTDGANMLRKQLRAALHIAGETT